MSNQICLCEILHLVTSFRYSLPIWAGELNHDVLFESGFLHFQAYCFVIRSMSLEKKKQLAILIRKSIFNHKWVLIFLVLIKTTIILSF